MISTRWMWWVTVAMVVAFLVVIFLALCMAQERMDPEEEARLIREQMEERRRMKALRDERRKRK